LKVSIFVVITYIVPFLPNLAGLLTSKGKTVKMYISVPTTICLGKMNNLGTKEINYGSTMRTHR